jgi:hypothetical protein
MSGDPRRGLEPAETIAWPALAPRCGACAWGVLGRLQGFRGRRGGVGGYAPVPRAVAR